MKVNSKTELIKNDFKIKKFNDKRKIISNSNPKPEAQKPIFIY